jgi:hypothetical protein
MIAVPRDDVGTDTRLAKNSQRILPVILRVHTRARVWV